MFNAPRPSQPYNGSSSNNFGVASFVDENPLAASAYDGLDPWSAAPTPSPPPGYAVTTGLATVLGNATIPPVYHKAFDAINTGGTGELSVSALSRVLATSSLSASTIDKIVSLVSSRPRVSRSELYVAMALAALAQSGLDMSIERVAVLAQQDSLPEPKLELSTLSASPPDFFRSRKTSSGFGRGNLNGAPSGFASDDPWSTARFPSAAPSTPGALGGALGALNGTSSLLSGTGLPKDWWKKQETVKVELMGQQGFILNRYTVYEVKSDQRGAAVPRRYSEFVFLWDVLVRRYPFRLLPALPPKRIGPDENFIEQRRRGLARFLNFVLNHPVIKDDGLLTVFLTEPSFETWRKQASISLDEESASKRVDKAEEMAIPSDFDDKLKNVRNKINSLIEQWQKICILTERAVKRRESAAVRIPLDLRRAFHPAHFALPFSLLPQSGTSFAAALNPSSSTSMMSATTFDMADLDGQSDAARLTNTLRALVEVNGHCWRGEECELCGGVRAGITTVAEHTQRHSDLLEERTRTLLYGTLEALKGQRDLYIAMRDLFIRHDRLSGDNVDRLKKRVETNSTKLDGLRAAQKDGAHEEIDRVANLIERDQVQIGNLLNRRVFIRACMWHELRVVLHNRENTLLTQTVRSFAVEETSYSENVASNWALLAEAVENMPYE
ncbi:hypothetical protein NEOLEDRAFT_1103309 [Neolentinus lepideus HHB14362 ss-1]|uniref:Sorting nexin MVP1 n=1 Tax=Neolentinus lepideus HHB14362 ss-1 TaxID=1314782 RepID=A0A165MQT7_9AGAM|nr:hypothetical protein NEOLEDRAFT_1103309 [Neolentinus lepideus HHB14362 ss-1]